jgi:Type II CAAX prenyl endopeptidase Rce1-like
MVLSVLLVSGTQLGADLAALYTTGLPPLGLFFIYSKDSSFPISINFLAYIGFCILVFAACFIAGFRSRGGFLPSLRKLSRVGRITSTSNWMVVMPLVSSALLVVVVLVTILLSASGVPSGMLCKPGVDCPSTAFLFAGLAHAPIGEELAYRIITPLGLIVPIRLAWRRLVAHQGPSKAKFLSIIGISIISPEHAKASSGYPSFSSHGWRGIHWLEWIFIAVSSILFGLAHVHSG